jgi:hypothetical protein
MILTIFLYALPIYAATSLIVLAVIEFIIKREDVENHILPKYRPIMYALGVDRRRMLHLMALFFALTWPITLTSLSIKKERQEWWD